jgi:predicted PurR-regulated permease PerM
MSLKSRELAFLVFLLVVAGVLSFFIFKGFLPMLVLATVFAIAFAPVYTRVNRKVSNVSLASLLTILIMIVFIAIPLSLLCFMIFNESRDLVATITAGGRDSLVTFIESNIDKVRAWLPFDTATVNLGEYVRSLLGSLSGSLGVIFGNIAHFLGSIFLFFIALYYFLKDGEGIRSKLVRLSPLQDKDDTELIDRVILSIESLVRGTLLIAVIKGILAAIGFAIFGLANPILWGLVAGLSSLIPGIGTAIVFIPAVLLLLFQGHLVGMVGLLIWGVVIVGFVDNLLGPKLMGKGTNLHPLLVLLSVLGGLSAFGITGFILGPVIVSLFFNLTNIIYTSHSE